MFEFFEECIIVKGSNGVVIHNLLDGRIYSFSDKQAEIVSFLKDGFDINYIEGHIKVKNKFIMDLIDHLLTSKLGTLSSSVQYPKKQDLVYPPYWHDYIYFKPGITINKVTLSLGGDCKKNCFFCNDEYYRASNCFGCYRNAVSLKIDEEYLFKFIDRVNIIGYNIINMVGGDLFYNKNLLKRILENIGNNQHVINIFWGVNDINEEIFILLKKYNVNLFVQIIDSELYSDKLNNLFQYIKRFKIKSSAIIVSENRAIADQYDEIKAYYVDYPISWHLNFIFKKKDSEKFKDVFMETMPIQTSIREYLQKKMYNSCLYGSIVLNEDGSITTCPRMPQFKLGTVFDISDAFKFENYEKYWRLTKEKISKCNDCKFRYVCNDCRFIQYKLTDDIYGNIECRNLSK